MSPRAHRALFGALFLASGGALLVYIVAGLSLGAGVAVSLTCVIVAGGLLWRRLTEPEQVRLRQALRAGVLAGLLATGAYDLFRYLLVEVAGLSFWPFDIFTIFGQALLGAGFRGRWVTAAGVGYHLLNGVGFATAYTVWLGRRGVAAGIAWAMVLETLMVTVYPGWLGLRAMNEFLQVSIFGHVVYGAVLGYTARRLLAGREGTGHAGA